MRRLPALLVLALLAVTALAADRVPKRLVHVRVPSPDRIAALVEAGFDIAGMNKRDQTVGVVATDDEIRRLESLGFGFTLGPSNDDPVTIQALQDYTDPAEMA
ncbi:MAG TPA: hypothetical protein VF139_10655, partial [Candidatus Polarisedimenticolaceae bacterium]